MCAWLPHPREQNRQVDLCGQRPGSELTMHFWVLRCSGHKPQPFRPQAHMPPCPLAAWGSGPGVLSLPHPGLPAPRLSTSSAHTPSRCPPRSRPRPSPLPAPGSSCRELIPHRDPVPRRASHCAQRAFAQREDEVYEAKNGASAGSSPPR